MQRDKSIKSLDARKISPNLDVSHGWDCIFAEKTEKVLYFAQIAVSLHLRI